MAMWQLLLAAIGHRDKHGRSRTTERVASAARVVFYPALVYCFIQSRYRKVGS
jgi:hypothetical protein